MQIIRIGTRGSALAIRQTEIVEKCIKEKYPEVIFERKIIKTTGDIRTDVPLADNGGKGLFISEIEKELLSGNIDIAVHSAKDLPSLTEEPFEIAGVLPRANPKDVFIVLKNPKNEIALKAYDYLQCGNSSQSENFDGLTIGTSSPRREELIKRLLPGVKTVLLRGNVNTRIQRLKEGVCDATLLAAAGIERLGQNLDTSDIQICELDVNKMIPGACQGIIAVESLIGSEASKIIRNINDESTKIIFDVQRKIMNYLDADCHDAAGVYAYYKNELKDTIGVYLFYKDSEIFAFDISECDSDDAIKRKIDDIGIK